MYNFKQAFERIKAKITKKMQHQKKYSDKLIQKK
jgi:hypothetical protein